MLRRYWPPTSNRAWVIWPREHKRTASINERAEPLPAEVSEQRRLRERACDARGGLAQHRVAGVIAEQVVHVLEAVEIQVHERHSLRLDRREALRQARAEQVLVGQPGQRVEGERQAIRLHR